MTFPGLENLIPSSGVSFFKPLPVGCSSKTGHAGSALVDLPEGLFVARPIPSSRWHATEVCAVSECSLSTLRLAIVPGSCPEGLVSPWPMAPLQASRLMRLAGRHAIGRALERSAHIHPLRFCGLAGPRMPPHRPQRGLGIVC